MANFALMTPRLSDAATVTAGSAHANFPVTNLQADQLGKVWRSAGLSDLTLDIDFGAATAVNAFALLAHNGTSAAQWAFAAATSQGGLAAPAYSIAAASMFPITRPATSDYPLLPSYKVLAASQSYRWWRITITDAANGDGYFKAGRLIVDAAWRPERNIAYGWGLEPIDNSSVEEAVGGQLHATDRDALRWAMTVRFGWATRDDLYGNFYEIVRKRRMSKPVFALIDPAATTHWHRFQCYGLMRQISPFTEESYSLFECSARIEEMRV